MKQLSQIYLLSLLIISVSGCSTLNYYSQAIGGQWSLMMARQPVSDMLKDGDTPAALKQSLMTAKTVREFANQELALPVSGTFTDYVVLDRPYVVVNLVAVPEFSLQPHQWCYPVIGCQAYRGYFNNSKARAEEKIFRAKGYDTFIGGVTAYSTLGWFNDPLHSGFTRLPPSQMAALIIHELSHQVVYIPGDTAFNESFATAVELEGLKRWLDRQNQPAEFDRALARLQHRNQTLDMVTVTTGKLEALYQQQDALPNDQLRSRKAAIFEQLRETYIELSEHWTEPGPLGSSPPSLNNANLALFQQYNQYVPGFRQLLRDHNSDFKAFYRAVIALSVQPEAERRIELTRLAETFNEDL